MVDAVSLLRERAEKDEPNSLFSLVNDLSKVLCKKVISEQLWPLVSYLMEGLVDWQGHSSSGACVVLNQITKLRGSALSEKVCMKSAANVHVSCLYLVYSKISRLYLAPLHHSVPLEMCYCMVSFLAEVKIQILA